MRASSGLLLGAKSAVEGVRLLSDANLLYLTRGEVRAAPKLTGGQGSIFNRRHTSGGPGPARRQTRESCGTRLFGCCCITVLSSPPCLPMLYAEDRRSKVLQWPMLHIGLCMLEHSLDGLSDKRLMQRAWRAFATVQCDGIPPEKLPRYGGDRFWLRMPYSRSVKPCPSTLDVVSNPVQNRLWLGDRMALGARLQPDKCWCPGPPRR